MKEVVWRGRWLVCHLEEQKEAYLWLTVDGNICGLHKLERILTDELPAY